MPRGGERAGAGKPRRYSETLLQVRITEAMKHEMEAFAASHETDLSDMTRRAIRLMLDMAKVRDAGSMV